MNNENVVRNWIRGHKSCGKSSNGNLSYNHNDLYSYRTIVARKYRGGQVVVTSHRYSATTNGKHLLHVRRLLSNDDYYVTCEIDDLSNSYDFDDVRSQIVADYDLKIKAERLRISRAKKHTDDFYLKQLLEKREKLTTKNISIVEGNHEARI